MSARRFFLPLDFWCAMKSLFYVAAVAGLAFVAVGVSQAAEGEVDFNRDIRPILSGKCFHCHGPDPATREAGLRLDLEEAAQEELDSGATAVVPGKPDESELLARVLTDDASMRMPPAETGKPLSAHEKELLQKWIEEGGAFQQHWSFAPPQKVEPPKVEQADWVRHPIDAFILQRLEQEGLTPAPEADRYTLARRLALSLTGLPLSPEETEAFVRDESPEAYEKLVDRLLADPAYGERWGRVWLDIARYADSAGYAQDDLRTIWRYRDWVIQGFNANMPYDQFTIEQLAGDLLPEPTNEQLIATAFHRNTMTNSEGGTNDEEFRNAAVVDRVNTTLSAWMGLTMECAQCHTHKYDPITHQEYFEFFAIFNQTADADRPDEAPVLKEWIGGSLERRESVQAQLKVAEAKLKEIQGQIESVTLPDKSPNVGRYVRVEHVADEAYLHIAEVQVFSGDENVALTGSASQVSEDYAGAPKLAIDGNTDGRFFDAKSTIHTKKETNPWWEVDLGNSTTIDKVVIWNRTDGDLFNRMKSCRVVLLDEARKPVWAGRINAVFNPSAEFIPPKSVDGMDESARKELAAYLRGNSPELEKQKQEIAKLEKQLAAIKPVPTPILRELPPDQRRKTHIHLRGSYQDLGVEVGPGVLDSFHPSPAGEEVNRLTMARWLVDRQNPLTARVVVNRYWEQLFGIGIVETSEDFGSQGELPTHPELLDYLAVELMEHDWDIKWLLKQIVLSSTFRQAAIATPEKLQRDSRNQLLSRGPRVRLSAEMIRDQALAVSGLLSEKMLGPSVRPPRPNLGLRAAFGGSTDWETSPGEDRYRRGLYTSWRRSTPYPSMTTFDAPSREVCTIRRISTNTPLQALVTLNDPVYVEAAQALARKVWQQKELSLEARVEYAVRRCLGRPATEQERARLVKLFQVARDQYAAVPEEALKMGTDPLGPLPEDGPAEELAAWTIVGNVLLNLDEMLNR